MGELKNCPSCDEFFNYTGLREVCNNCAMNEEKLYETVYRFLRKRENRAATIERIVEVTGVEESLLHKWVRKNRLQPAMFPNLGYPCDNCGKITQQGKLCKNCVGDLQSGLRQFDAAKEFRDKVASQESATYHADNKRK
ncbi:TIGR03826 family flagellar region protein [Psychrobacillus antarcticus]|uniref:TIGR03826 family flagellar region protein n=1 Tax=Psychrobacillus antarcticus TaxID=2879115 RepID=UPI002408828D|nr:TIGR03826 family flagellar region protein [Psychrobacillus antarcticus]